MTIDKMILNFSKTDSIVKFGVDNGGNTAIVGTLNVTGATTLVCYPLVVMQLSMTRL